jgi:predicted phosphoribosyltransferase
MRFRDRAQAGSALAERLRHYRGRDDLVVLGLPRGGVPVAFQLAQSLGAPLDVFVVRKLGAPGQEELALGAIASGGVRVINDAVVRELGLDEGTLEHAAAVAGRELARREELYRNGRPSVEVAGRTAILVDDGLATGASMRAAARAVRQRNPERVVVAVPVAARQTCEDLAAEVDEIVCLEMPTPFLAVGSWYDEFGQTTDDEVRELLARAAVQGPKDDVGYPGR